MARRSIGAPDAYPFPTLPAPFRFAVALVAVSAVFVTGRVGGSAIDGGSQFLLLGTAVMASAWFAGTGPALAATVLGALLGATELQEVPTGPAAPMHLAIFVVQGLLLTALVAELRAARRASEHQTAIAQAARRDGEAANRTKDEFLATISHELRTPLNAVLGWVHLLRTGKLDQESAARGLESIERNVRLQAQVTTDLLDVSKALTGQLQLESVPTALGDSVQHAMSAVAPAARARGISVRIAQADPAVVLGDPVRLRQIARHLVANAIKFTPRGGRIDVSVACVGQEARLVVRDTGLGIDPQFLPRIFERFTQADSSATRPAGGLGVGLALVRELVELQGGEIEARNATDPAGAILTARFPLQPADSLERRPGGDKRPPAFATVPPLDGVRVLVLDQDLEAGEVVRRLLQHRGASVRAVSSVADALEILEAWRPDVLVSDAASPQHDSYTLVGKVHALDTERGGRIPALALTTLARTDERLAPLLADVHSELPKPIEPALLTAEIARLTGRERRRVRRQDG